MQVFQQLTPPPEKAYTDSHSKDPAVSSLEFAGRSYQHTSTTPNTTPIEMRPYFDNLPVEILSMVAQALEKRDNRSTKALRCVSKSCAAICTRLVFRSSTLLLRQKSIEKLNHVLDSPDLRCAVMHLMINTADYTDTCLDSYDWEDRDAELFKSFLDVLSKVGRLRNLRSVKLKFSHECVGPQQRRRWWARGVPESIDFRTDVLRSLFAGLNYAADPPPKLDSLSVENLQGCSNEAVVGSADFKSVMSRIRKLELQIATEDVDGNGSFPANLEKKEAHTFFKQQLTEGWLERVRNNLTHLKLYSRDMYFGYLPRCQLPVFSQLQSLILGGMSFSHDDQLNWILAHGDTLQEIILDNCPIIIGVRIPSTLDSENFPIEPLFNSTVTGSLLQISTFGYPMRWHDYFHHFATGLPHLRSIRCGFGDWYAGNAFPKSTELGIGLWAQRYRIFDDGEWRRPPFEEGTYDGEWSNPPVYPDCTDEDWNALCEVKRAIQQRSKT